MAHLQFGQATQRLIDAHNVSLELVSHTDNWPPAVQQLSQLLAKPLPSWLKTGPYPFTSHRSSPLLPLITEAVQSIDLVDNMEIEEPRLQDVFDLVLSTTSLLRELRRRGNCYQRPTLPLWSTLIRSLGRTCCPDASILYEQPLHLRTVCTKRCP